MAHYERLGVVGIEPVIQAILDHAAAPRVGSGKIKIQGAIVRISGLRLRTFAESPLCCSNPHCKNIPTHFAVERSMGNEADSAKTRPYHLNLYGRNARGDEVLFTHDHTLARALGGSDERSNTTTMCLPCNRRKAVLESQLVNQRRNQTQGKPNRAGPSEKKLARQRQVLLDESELANMEIPEFIKWCDQQGRQWHDKKSFTDRHRAPMARALGLSVAGYAYLRHQHNLRMIQAQSPAFVPRRPKMG